MAELPTHRTPSSAGRREERDKRFLQPMFDTPVPRPHAGRKSIRKPARPWESTGTGDGKQPPISRFQRRRIQRHLKKHHHAD